MRKLNPQSMPVCQGIPSRPLPRNHGELNLEEDMVMSPRYLVACSTFVIVTTVLFSAVPPESNGQNKVGDVGRGLPNWEYKILGAEGNETTFNDLGEQGWELVAVAGATRSAAGSAGSISGVSTSPAFYFKRRK